MSTDDMNLKSGNRYLLTVVFAAVQFLPGLLPTVVAAELIYENTFESGWGDVRHSATGWQPAPCDQDFNFQLVPDPDDAGNQVVQLIQEGDMGCTDDLKHRTQFWFENPTTGKLYAMLPHVEYWIGFRMYIPASFPASVLYSRGESPYIWEASQSQPGEAHWTLTGNASGNAILEFHRRYNRNSDGALITYNKKAATLKMGAWNTIIFSYQREWDTTGFMHAWVNGTQVMNDNNVQTASDPAIQSRNVISRFGIYWGKEDRPYDIKVLFDDYRMATGADGYNLVNPSTNGSVLVPPNSPTGIQLQITSPGG